MHAGAWGEAGTGDRRVAEVAHDLRMPLALILAHCERLASTLSDRDQLVEIDQIRDTASRMGRQVDGLVHSAAPAAVPVDAVALTSSIVERFRPLAHARGTELTFESPDAAIVLAGTVDLELALQNVIDNALRHARTGPVHVSVHVGLRHVSIDVADDGPGIPPSKRRSVLRAQTQAVSGDHEAGGAGLGLSIANDAVRSHGGCIRIGESAQGGALVTLQLPSPVAPARRRRRRALRSQLISRA